MYEAYFGLNRRPFPSAPDVHYYFPAGAIEAARQNLLRCLRRGEGTGLVIGPSGTGKTLLCQVLAEQLRSQMAVVHLCSGRLGSRAALYQAILHGLERPYRGMDEGELRLALVDYLTSGDDRPDGLALLIDEAQTMPLRLLDEIRMLTNVVSSGQPRVRVLLAGSPLLEERLASPRLESFSQRLVVRCYLEPFHRAETEQYVRAQVDAAAGGPNSCFAPEAAVAVHQATEGVPRLVNQLCDHALLLAYADGSRAIDTAAVETAWADLQQLPAPWTGDAADHGPRNVIEFGGLDDDAISGEERGATKAASLELLSEDEDESTIDELQRTLDELQEPSVSAGNAELFHPLETIGPEADLALDEPRGPFAEPFSEEEEIVQPYRETAAPERAESRKSPAADVRRTPSLSTAATRRERPCAQGDGTWPGSDLIVFDDEAESPEPEVTPPTVVGRSSQYRHLFAKLRQGC